MENTYNIQTTATHVLLRIFVFLLFYMTLIAVGIGILVGAFKLSIWFINSDVFFVGGGRLFIIGIIALVGIWALAAMLGFYLIKPLFSSTKNTNENRLEIKKGDCPELFSMIEEVARKTKCKFPKHIYLSSDVNACVFYDTNFWSIFFPVRKNIEIGLGLFHSTNIEELKSVIAHEFGHFSQNSMKVGSTVYVANNVIYNLVYTEDTFDTLLNEWCLSENGFWSLFGLLTRTLTNQIKKLNVRMYRFVQKGYLQLSRQMEYDADRIAYNCVGVSPFVSALCKIEITSQRHNMYERFLSNLLAENKEIDDYWQGYSAIEAFLMQEDQSDINHKSYLTEPVATMDSVCSKIEIHNIWSSHPLLKERIANVKSFNMEGANTDSASAWTLIPQNIKQKVGKLRIAVIKRQYEGNFNHIEITDFKQWVGSEIENYFIPQHLKPYFDRNITIFEVAEEEKPQQSIKSPFTEENKTILMEYEMAIQDWNMLLSVANKAVDVKELKYENTIYTRKNLPIEKHQNYLLQLKKKAIVIDQSVYWFLKQNAPQKDIIESAYAQIFYIMSIFNPMYQDIMETRNELVDEMNKVVRRDAEMFNTLVTQIQNCESALQQFIAKLDMKMLSTVVREDHIDALMNYQRQQHNALSLSIDIDTVKEMISIIDAIGDMHNHLRAVSYRMIVQEAKKTNMQTGNN